MHEGSTAEFVAMPYWYILSWGGAPIPIPNCPWCTERLPLPGEEEDCSGIDFTLIEE